MKSYVAVIRGINVGGKSMVAMADLRTLLEKEGFADVKTLLQSGNVVFKSKPGSAAAIEKQLEKAAEKKFGRALDFFVRDGGEWKKIVEENPFHDEAKNDPAHLVVLLLKRAAKAENLAALKAAIIGRQVFKAGERCLYLVYPDGIGTSKLTNAVIDRKLGTTGTARNWNTMHKIAALLEG
jgi:uncharacterized protein (DUF1697 family)